eukprot:m.144895 g.144895  ORF g.144895 m.144895 type:complete len:116 (+) comp38407_c3_seq42:2134-2481(+)
MNGADKGGRANSNRRTITTDMPDKINRFSNQKNLSKSQKPNIFYLTSLHLFSQFNWNERRKHGLSDCVLFSPEFVLRNGGVAQYEKLTRPPPLHDKQKMIGATPTSSKTSRSSPS